jgi:peptidoglycan/LPS O-acetylase OafA/YrhL
MALDAWRGLCACGVLLVHVPVAHHFHDAVWFSNMRIFVDFFFVLSGFVICHAYGARIQNGVQGVGFMIRRFGRVYPLHLAVLAGFVALELLKVLAGFVTPLPLDGVPFTEGRSLTTLISNLFLLQAFNLHGMTSWNTAAWSIGVEFYTYIVFAIVVVLWGARWGVFAILAGVGALGVAVFADDWLFTTHAFGFFRCLYGFFVGCLMYRLIEIGDLPKVLMGTGAEVAAIGALGLFMLTTGPDASSLLAPLAFGVILVVFAGESGAISRGLLSRPAQALGLWSYSIYMIHMLVFAGLKILLTFAAKIKGLGLSAPVVVPFKQWTLGHPVSDMALMIGHVALVLVLARFTYEWIEAPARTWFAARAARYERDHKGQSPAPTMLRVS